MGKFKEIDANIYNSVSSNADLAQPSFIGLIEIFKNFGWSDELDLEEDPKAAEPDPAILF